MCSEYSSVMPHPINNYSIAIIAKYEVQLTGRRPQIVSGKTVKYL